ncbi:MAG TPA: copper homeostasis protein CutC [Pirellulales bacterium]|jgi:copper homeostasis protein|nr:copper homeostasis protein CutC [Pirellulales bacterium]
MSRRILEVCLTSADEAEAAEVAGADRLELNAALALDGLTPSPGVLQSVLKATSLPIIAMVRPRPGGFCPGDADFAAMQTDAEWLCEAGVAGIAFGILHSDGSIDLQRCRRIRETVAGRVAVVFHRAFDTAPDPFVALEQLIDLGFTRVMTSGGAKTALGGADVICELIERARERIEILPAGGIAPANLRELMARTACRQVHGSFRQRGSPHEATDLSAVAAVRELLDS